MSDETNEVENTDEFYEEMKHRIHFSADDANNAANARKASAHLKKMGYSVTGQGGSGHRRVLDVTSPSSSHSARLHKMFGKSAKRYDTDVSDVKEEDGYYFDFGAEVEDLYEEKVSGDSPVTHSQQKHAKTIIKNKTGRKVYFDGSSMIDHKTDKTILDNALGKHSIDSLVRHASSFKEDLDEESIAGATLRAGSRPDENPKSKIEFMQRTLGIMNGMKKEDLSKFYNDVIAQIGKEADSLPASASSAANQGSIDMKTGKGPKTRDAMPKLSVREDVEEMFDGQELSEEFKDRASTLFEAAVTARISLELANLEEQYDNRLSEELEEIKESLEKGLDTYLDYVVEKWMDDNRVAIESSLRNEIMEEFIGGLKNLFAENYIEMPEEKIDVVESLANKVEELEAALAESINENAELKDVVAESVRHDVLNDLAEGLTMTQAEKFFALAEGIDFEGDLDVYARKLSVVKEQYFSKKSPTTAVNIEEETFEGDVGTQQATVSVDPSVGKYVQAISRTIKK